MRSSLTRILVVSVALALPESTAAAQKHYPPISTRQFVKGSVKITVTGAFTMDADVPLTIAGSFGDGEMTWLQFGGSGADAPNATVTFTDMGEVGIVVARGSVQGIGGIGGNEKPWCTGKLDVKPKLLTANYTCVGVTSHDKATDRVGKVTITLTFTAES